MIANQKQDYDFCGSRGNERLAEATKLLESIVAEVLANDCLEIDIASERSDSWSDARNYTITLRTFNPAA